MSLRTLRGLLAAALALSIGFAIGHSLGAVRTEAAPSSCPGSGGGPPFSLQSVELDRSRQTYLDALRLAGSNQLFPADEDFELPPLAVGRERTPSPTAVIPPQVLYAISWIESKINQTHIDIAYGALGPTLISHDCGYGIMQVTSSIVNDGGLPSRYEALVGTHFAYNIAAGARILAEKWNHSLFPTVGDHDPMLVESWYYALWAYNGWAGINHPAHPSNDPFRSPYQCGQARNGYPYQELVLRCIADPPRVDGRSLWDPLPVVLPDWTALSGSGQPLDLDVFFSGLDTFYVHPGGYPPPFAEMNIPLPSGAQPVAPVDTPSSLRRQVLGDPLVRLETGGLEAGELNLTSSQLASGQAAVEIHNDGTGLLAWRVQDAPSWLGFDIQAGVAVGAGYASTDRPLPSELRIAAAAGGVHEGSHRGRITIALDWPDGTTTTSVIPISLDKRGAAFYEAGKPQS